MAAIQGYLASVLYASYNSVALTDEVLTDSGDHMTFNISSASYATKRIWDRTATFSVQVTTDGGSTWPAAAAGYTIRYLTGQVVLAAPLTGTPGCRIHAGAYLPITTAVNAKSWEATPIADKYESTVFTGSGPVWKTYVPGLHDAQIKLGQWWADGTWIGMLLQGTGNNSLVVELHTGLNAFSRYMCYARIAQDDIKTPVNGLIEESIDLTSDGNVVFFSGQFN